MDMDGRTAAQAIDVILTAIQIRLEEAARIARAATACAQAGSIGEGVTLALDIEQPVHEADRLLDAASLLNRLTAD
jgi:hypothetical protein